jgi:SHS2 domain-containing protein
MMVYTMNSFVTHIDHTADLGINVYGDTQTDLFSHAALALIGFVTDVQKVNGGLEKSIVVEEPDQTDLFINFLREILYLINGEGFLFRNISIDITPSGRLQAFMKGEYIDRQRHEIKTEIKAVTYHQAFVRQTSQGWQGKVIFDV